MTGRHIQDVVVLVPRDGEIGLEGFETSLYYIFDYGRALPRGLVSWKNEHWIVARQSDGKWHLDIRLSEVTKERLHKHLKYRNYLRRVGLWINKQGSLLRGVESETADS